jgi:hypothetical protein
VKSQPNFVIAGAMRSGTSTLYELLRQHPDVFMSPVKEPDYFAFDGVPPGFLVDGSAPVTSRTEYDALFADHERERRVGEASHNYLYYSDTAAPRIHDDLGQVELIFILRHPVERAFSHWLFHVRNARESHTDFRSAVAAEDARVHDGVQFGHYVRRGKYASQLAPFLDRFDRSRLHLFLYEDLSADPVQLARMVFAALEVDDTFTPDTSVRANPSGRPRLQALNSMLTSNGTVKRVIQPFLPRPLYRAATRLRDWNLIQPSIEPDLRVQVAEGYRGEVSRLEDLIDRDLSAWRR